MTPAIADTWERGNPYERYIGRWSRRVAPPFLDWLHKAPEPTRVGDLIAILRKLAPIVETGRLAQPIAATALGELRKVLAPAAADVLVAGLTGGTDAD